MKRFFLLLLILFLLFLSLTYWSVSVRPSEIKLSEVIRFTGDIRKQDSVFVVPTNIYESNTLKRFMQGQNYREAWKTPIKAPVFFLDSMEILEEGGGQQSHSLKLRSAQGVEYSLRSINKDPQPLIPGIVRTLGLENIVIYGVSAQHPYGALLAAALAENAGILNTHPRIVYAPKQEKLGKYNEAYGNRLYLLEYETEGKVNWTKIQNFYEILDTDDLQELKKDQGKNVRIDERRFVRSRIFDLLIGDWDRHAKQWGWVVQEKDHNFLAVPLAGDRDNAFFRIDGVIPTILTNEFLQPKVRPFEENIDYIQGYVYPVDIYFLHNTSEKIFIEEARALQNLLSDEKIREAFKVWPKEIRQLNAEEIYKKLKERRSDLVEYAVEFNKEIKRKKLLEKPLKGSEDIELPEKLQRCFSCYE